MTTGQRIAAKRKEQNLSQEELGEQLGVSRQSIYKWESDASLPEIDKLISMSRMFQVSVGWLLGVEEESEAPSGGQLSEEQLKMVEEILSRYQQASLSEEQQAQVDRMVAQKLEKRTKSPWDKWSLRILFAICGFMVASILTINSKIDRSEQQYNSLTNSVNNVSYNVNSQINSITNRVEQVLKAQNDLTADYSVELVSADLRQNTVTFALRAVPKTYVEGMEVLFLVDTGKGPAEHAGQKGQGQEFTAELTCELTDSITLSVVFVHGETRQTQLLDNFSGLYSSSMPGDYIDLNFGSLSGVEMSEDGKFHLPESVDFVDFSSSAVSAVDTKLGQTAVRDMKLGLFHNRKLVLWLEPCDKPDNYKIHGRDESKLQFYRCPELALTMEEGDTLLYAALITDEYDRKSIAPSLPWRSRSGSQLEITGGDATPYFDIANYTF